MSCRCQFQYFIDCVNNAEKFNTSVICVKKWIEIVSIKTIKNILSERWELHFIKFLLHYQLHWYHWQLPMNHDRHVIAVRMNDRTNKCCHARRDLWYFPKERTLSYESLKMLFGSINDDWFRYSTPHTLENKL